jgi:uncharacterized membrane protein (DUF2068 family)
VLLLLQGLILTIVPGLGLSLLAAETMQPDSEDLAQLTELVTMNDILTLLSLLVIGIFGFVSSTGILRLRPWGWLMAMLVQGISLIVCLIDYVQGEPNYVWMLFSVVVVFYLNLRDIQQIFDIAAAQEQRKRPLRKQNARAMTLEHPEHSPTE